MQKPEDEEVNPAALQVRVFQSEGRAGQRPRGSDTPSLFYEQHEASVSGIK